MKSIIIAGIVVAIAIFILVFFITTSNAVNRIKVKIDESKSSLGIMFDRRYETLTQSINVCKSYKEFELELFTNLRKPTSESSMKELQDIGYKQEKAVRNIVALGEAYPDLKTATLFSNLQKQLSEENAEVAAAKRTINSNITELNNMIVTFPTSLVCSMKGLSKLPFFETENLEQKKTVEFNL